jgi:rfaE bifunctional protein nucleotidyltransferase chain/domain
MLVIVSGCYDLFHVGHLQFLQWAAARGQSLLVAVNSDQSVRSLKGPARPIVSQAERAAIVASLRCVNDVCLFDELDPSRVLQQRRPDVFVTGPDHETDTPWCDFVRSYGGTVLRAPTFEGPRTSELIRRCRHDTAHFGCR